MKVKNIIFISLFLLIILTIGAASAADDTNSSDIVSVDDDQGVINEDLDEDAILSDDGDDDDGEDESYDEVAIDIPDEVEDEDETATIELPDDAKGKVTVTVNGKLATLKVDTDEGLITILKPNSGSAVSIDADDETDWDISLIELGEGTYNITIEYKDDVKKTNTKYNVKVTNQVVVGESTGGDDDDDDDEGEVDEISCEDFYTYHSLQSLITIPKSFWSPSLKVIINNKTETIVNGTDNYFVNLRQYDMGDYDVLIYNDTQVFINSTFTVGGCIHASSNEFTYKDNAVITLELPANADGYLVIDRYVNNNKKEVFRGKLVNGTASYSLSTTSVGCYEFIASYESDSDDYDVDEFDEEITIHPIITCPTQMTVGEKKYMTFDFGSEAEGVVIVEDEVEEYARATLVNGTAKISLENLDDGVVELYVTFDINELQDLDTTFEVDVKEVPIKITGAKSTKMYYNDGTTLKFTVYGTNGKYAEKGEYAEIQIGKRSYDRSIGSNGVVSIIVPKSIAPGKYTVKTVYEDVTYKSTLYVKHVLKLKKVKVKKSAKKVVLKATLKQGKKALKGKKVTFRFKGKKITVKTNKKGVATVKVKKSILKKLKVGKKFKYQARYLNDKVVKSVKVKK